MILAIDIGNTNVKCKAWKDDVVLFVISIDVRSIHTLLDVLGGDWPSVVVLASVGAQSIEAQVKELFHDANFIHVESTIACMGVVNGYDDPAKLGVDRWLALIEAYHRSGKKACCVIDFGTALTLDVVNEKGMHQGGFIVPGLTLMRESLLKSTEKVRYESRNSLAFDYGLNTADAVECGTFSLVVAWLIFEIQRFHASNVDGCVYLTGGMAKNIWPFLKEEVICEQDLVLDALKRVASS